MSTEVASVRLTRLVLIVSNTVYIGLSEKNFSLNPILGIDGKYFSLKLYLLFSICALHYDKVYAEGFICSNCRQDLKRPLPENKFTAKSTLSRSFVLLVIISIVVFFVERIVLTCWPP